LAAAPGPTARLAGFERQGPDGHRPDAGRGRLPHAEGSDQYAEGQHAASLEPRWDLDDQLQETGMRSENERRSLPPLVLERALRCEFGNSSAVGQLAGTETTEDVPEITIFSEK